MYLPNKIREKPRPVTLPLFGFVTLSLFRLLQSTYVLLRDFPPPPPVKSFSVPPLSTPESGPLHPEDSLLLMMFLFGHAIEIRRCSFQRNTDDSHLPPKADSCWSRDPTPPGCLTDPRRVFTGELNRATFCGLTVLETKRLRSSSGHGGGWRTGVDFQCAGSFTHRPTRLSCPWGRDPWGTRNIVL